MWVYFCGLTRDFNAPEEVECRKVINQIGHEFSIKFLAIKSYKNHLILRICFIGLRIITKRY
jgi:hypothetical protein